MMHSNSGNDAWLNATDRGAPGGWYCPACGVEVDGVQQYCTVCLRARPLSRKGVPQIFSGMRMHFNGIIPRTLKHPSHSVEWRMAERHGAICEMVFDPASTNLLVYRPGYERSDKVRLCVERYNSIHCVPIAWLLDSLLQSRQIHPVLYRLQSVPSVALPTVRGPVLPHHQHPFYVLHAEEYALGPLPGSSSLTRHKSAAALIASTADALVAAPLTETPEPVWQSVSLWEAADEAIDRAAASITADEPDVHDDEPHRRLGSSSLGLECFTQLLRNNRLNRVMLRGMIFVLSPTLRRPPTGSTIVKVLEGLGGAVMSAAEDDDMTNVAAVLQVASHVVYHNDDKKERLMIEACQAAATVNPGLVLASHSWLEDSLMLGEIIPVSDVYGPSAKLRQTLLKKWERKAAAATGQATPATGAGSNVTTPAAVSM